MVLKPFLNYRLFIWGLLALAILMGGVFLVIAYTYKLQKETETYIQRTRSSVDEAREMENELTAINALTYTYLVNKSNVWLDSLTRRQTRFVVHLERARQRTTTDEEESLIQQISALFSNYEQNIRLAVAHYRAGEVSKANALLTHSAEDLLGTITRKSNEFITLNKQTGRTHEIDLARTNTLILYILIVLGIGGILSGLLLGWLISRRLFSRINQLVLSVREASGQAVVEHFQISGGGELDELGERIKELVRRINQANEDLIRNKELLQHSNKYATLGKIVPTIAHEIRNPLAAIKMLVYSMREGQESPKEISEDLDIILNEIDRMEQFTKDILRFAKPAHPVFSRVNPLDSLAGVVQLMKPRLNKNRIVVVNNTPQQEVLVMADEGHLRQIYMNIILNAVEAMSGGGTINIEAELVRDHKPDSDDIFETYFRIEFSDTGPGIPEAIQKTLFDPFIKGSDQGVGIGLSISQSIANAHGGWISAHNHPDRSGAVFVVYLPLNQKTDDHV